MELSTNNVSPDAETVKNRLGEIRDQLTAQDTDAAKASATYLGSESQPKFTMEMLAPCLFADDSSKLGFTNQDALTVVTFLVSVDAVTYYKPASRAVKAAAESLTSKPTDQLLVVSDEVLSVLVAQLSGDDVEVSNNASETITMCSRRLGPPLSDRAIRAITDSWRQALEQMPSDRAKYSTVSVRCASAVVDLATLGDASMESAISCGATDLLVTMATDDSDPLMQMSTLDLMERLANTFPMHTKRAQWLFSRDVLHPLLVMAGGNGPNEEPDPILGGSALRLLSSLCRLSQRDSSLFGLGGSELLTSFHHALRKFEGSGELERLALIDAVSSFASASPDALEVVLDDEMVRVGWLSLAVAQPKLKSVVLKSVANVIDPPAEVDANGDSVVNSNIPSNSLSMKLYSSLGQVNNSESTELVLSLAKSPIVETRLGAYALLEAVAKRGTGAQVLLSRGGFFEFLISREGETTKEGKEAKFEIVQAVMQSDARGLLAENVVDTLSKIISQGPHYVQTQSWDVGVE